MSAKINIEELIRTVYRRWKRTLGSGEEDHPDEEAMASFAEGILPEEEGERVKAHLIACEDCAQAFALSLSLDEVEAKDLPEELLQRVKGLLRDGDKALFAHIVVKARDKFLEVLTSGGDILLGQELIPVPVLRSRQIKDFKDEVTILKDFKDIRVQIRIENKGKGVFNLALTVTHKENQNIIKELRATLFKDDLELESYLTDTGKVIFEHVFLGKYTVEISTLQEKLASVVLEIKI